MTTKTPAGTRVIAGLLGALFLAAAGAGLAGCNKRENPPAATTDSSPSSSTTTTPAPAPTLPASDSMPATPAASAASQ
jgi:hypothetical protein